MQAAHLLRTVELTVNRDIQDNCSESLHSGKLECLSGQPELAE